MCDSEKPAYLRCLYLQHVKQIVYSGYVHSNYEENVVA